MMIIRPVRKNDVPKIFRIEKKCFEFPWKKHEFVSTLSHADNFGNLDSTGMVAVQGNRIVGFIIYRQYEDRFHIMSIAIDIKFRRCGIGTALVKKVIEELGSQKIKTITLGVREKNLAAQLFFRANGFRVFNTLCNYYQETGEDAYLMQYQ